MLFCSSWLTIYLVFRPSFLQIKIYFIKTRHFSCLVAFQNKLKCFRKMSTSHYCFICKKTRDVTTKMPQNHNELSVWLARLQLQVPVHLYDYYRNYYICEQHFTPGSLSSTTRRPPSLQPLPPSTSNVFAQNSLNVALSSSSTHSNRTTMPATSPKIVRLIRCTPIVAPMLSQTSAANQVSNPTRVQILTTPRQMPSLLLTQSNVENEPMETGTDVEENSSEEDESAVDDDLNEEDQEVAEEELPANDKVLFFNLSPFYPEKFSSPWCKTLNFNLGSSVQCVDKNLEDVNIVLHLLELAQLFTATLKLQNVTENGMVNQILLVMNHETLKLEI